MSTSKLRTFRDALAELSGEDDGLIEAWGRRVVFEETDEDGAPWEDLGAEDPPSTFTLMVRPEEEAWEMIWLREDGDDLDGSPVVEITQSGESQVLAPNVDAWIDALIFSRGALGGGSEEELDAARDEATREARDLAEALQDELERDTADPVDLGDKWDELQDAIGDLWEDAAQGLE